MVMSSVLKICSVERSRRTGVWDYLAVWAAFSRASMIADDVRISANTVSARPSCVRSMLNQRVNTAIRAFHKTRPDWMILCGLMELLGVYNKADSAEAVFQELSENEKGFQGLQWESIGSDGINVAQFDDDPGRNEVSELSKTA